MTIMRSGLVLPFSALFVPVLLVCVLALPAACLADSFSAVVETAIPDADETGLSSSVNVVDDITITDVNVVVDIEHPYRGDLYVTLRSPSGTTVVLFNRRGGSSDDLKVTFDTAETPDESLAVFNGEAGRGTWTINVSDRASGDTGTFNSWTLVVEGYLGSNYSTVSGSLRYEDRVLTPSGFQQGTRFLPIRHCDVELVRASDGATLASGRSDDDGAYSMRVERQGAVDCYLRAYARAVDGTRVARVLDDSSNLAMHTVVSSSSSRDTDRDIQISLDAVYDGGSGAAGAFNILDMVCLGQERIAALGAARPPLLTCFWKEGATDGTYYSASDRSLHLLGSQSDSDEFDDSVITHELGHYAADVYSVDTSPGGAHSWSDGHQDLRLAWSEGWANFFSSMVRESPDYLDSFDGGVTSLEIETPSFAAQAMGQDCESTVHSFLWDIYDGVQTADDSPGVDDDVFDCSCGASAIWNVFAGHVTEGFNGELAILEGFYDGWLALYGRAFYKQELDDLLAMRSVSGLDRHYLFTDDTDRVIPDLGEAVAPMDVAEDLTISSVQVFVHVDHSFPRDLTISLRHPDGTTVRLHDRGTGTTAAGLVTWYGPYEADPVDSLSNFAGKTASGQWRLVITDNAANDTGSLKMWKLALDGTPADADLVVDAVESPSSVIRGQETTVSVTLRNRGASPVNGQFHESLFLSRDRTITTTDLFLGSFAVAGLAAGASTSNVRTLTIPSSVEAGRYYIGALADWNGSGSTVAEAVETNNAGVAPGATLVTEPSSGVQLYPVSLSGPASATAGATFTVSAVIGNSGAEKSTIFTNRYYLSADTFINPSEDREVGAFTWAELEAASSVQVDRVLSVPGDLTAGDYYLGVLVDADSQVVETDEGDNVGLAPSRISISESVGGVDLRVESLSAPSSAVPSSTIQVDSSVRNAGTSAAVDYGESYYLSPDAVIDGTGNDVLLASWTVSRLDAAATTSPSRSMTVPATAGPGDYYIGLVVHDEADVNHLNDTLVRSISIEPVPGSDLAPGNVVGPRELNPGSTANFTYSVSNAGAVDAPSSRAALYLSADRTIATSDIFVAYVATPKIQGGSGGTFTVTTMVPQTVPGGSYYAGIIVDALDEVDETNEDNNSLAASATTLVTSGDLPNLVPASLAFPSRANAGASVTVTWRSRNLGSSATPSSFDYAFYLSVDETASTSEDLRLGTMTETSVLLPGADLFRSVVLTIPSTVASADYHLWVTADASGNIIEQSESDNTLVSTATISVSSVISGTDLAPASVTTPSTASAGNAAFFEAVVSNNGQTDATGNFRVDFYLSPDEVISTSDTLVTSVTLAGLDGGALVPLRLVAGIPASVAPGDYFLGVIVDAADSVSESDESNNAMASSTTFTVQATPTAADLVPLVVAAPDQVAIGGSIDVSAVMANYGNTAAPAPFVLRFVLTADAVVDASDPVIGMYTRSSALPGVSSTSVTCVCTIASFIPPGLYGVGVVLDDFDSVPESNEGNNTLVGQGSIIVSAVSEPPDLVVTGVSTGNWARVGDTLSVSRKVSNIGMTDISANFEVHYYLSSDQVLDSGDHFLGSFLLSGLSAGAEDERRRALTVPGSVGPGSYWVIVFADGGLDVSEGVETNNLAVSDGRVVVSGAPDLAVRSVSITSPATVGSIVTIDRTVENLGTAALTRSVAIRYYLSTDEVIDTGPGGDNILFTENFTSGLAAGASASGATTCVMPAHISPWTYHIGACVDVLDEVLEGDESNNCTTAPLASAVVLGAPDLQALSVSTVTSGVQGTPMTVSLSVKNYQNTSSVPFTAAVRLSTDTAYDTGDVFVGYVSFGGLAPLKTAQVSSTFTVPVSASGSLYTVAWVDPEGDGSIGETVEGAGSNSVSSPTSSVYSEPDTTPPSVDVSYWMNGVEITDTADVPAGNLLIVASFDEEILPVPLISIDQQGSSDVVAAPMSPVAGNPRAWLYSYTVSPDDGGANRDGWVDVSFSGVSDLQGNAMTTAVVDSFRVDTLAPSILVTSPALEYPAARVTSVNYTLAGTIVDASAVVATYSVNYGTPSTLTLSGGSFSQAMVYSGPAAREAPDTIIVQATDAAGNHAVARIFQVTLDTDGDGIADWYEYRYPSVLNPLVAADALNDPDGDGLINRDEYRNSTDPTVPDGNVPVASAGPDQSGGPRVVVLDGTASHSTPPGQPLQYAWTYDSGPVPSVSLFPSPAAAQPYFTATVHGTYTFSLQVFDGSRWSVPDSVSVVVGNGAPFAHAGYDLVCSAGDSVTLDGSRSADPEGAGPLTYSWTADSSNPASVAFTPSSSVVAPTVTLPSAGVYTFFLDVDDVEGEPAPRTDAVTVVAVDPSGVGSPPYADAGGTRSIVVPASTVLDGRASADGDAVGISDWWWSLVSGPAPVAILYQDQPQAMVTVGTRGAYTFSLSVEDSVPLTAPEAFVRVMAHSPGDLLACADAGDDVDTEVGTVVTLNASASLDPEGAGLQVLWTQLEGPTVTLSSNSSLTPSFGPVLPGRYRFRLFVRDGGLQWQDYDDVVVRVHSSSNVPPTASARIHPVSDPDGDGRVSAGAAVFLDASSSTDGGDGPSSLQLHWVQRAGAWVRLSDPTATQPNFVPPVPGVYVFELCVYDGDCESRTILTVIADSPSEHVPSAVARLSAASDPDGDGVVYVAGGARVVLDGSASADADGDGLSWSWSQQGGPWVVLDDPTSPTPSFSPSGYGEYRFRLTVYDGTAASAATELVFTLASGTAPSGGGGGGGGGGGCQVFRGNGRVSARDAGRPPSPSWLFFFLLPALLALLRRRRDAVE